MKDPSRKTKSFFGIFSTLVKGEQEVDDASHVDELCSSAAGNKLNRRVPGCSQLILLLKQEYEYVIFSSASVCQWDYSKRCFVEVIQDFFLTRSERPQFGNFKVLREINL